MKILKLVAFLLACSACHDQLTVRQTVELLSRWDSLHRQMSLDGLAWTHAPINSLPAVPAALEIPVQLDRRRVIYNALVFEKRTLNAGQSFPGHCVGQTFLSLVLWRQADADSALDVISIVMEAQSGPMEGAFDPVPPQPSCNFTSPRGVAYLNGIMFPILGTGRPALAGRFRVTRFGNPASCVFIRDLEALNAYGTTCETRRYSFDLDATLSNAGRAAGGATHIRASSNNLPGAIFTVDCNKTEWARQHCG